MQETLDALARRDEPIVVKLERQPGQKEARYAHLLSGPVEAFVATTTAAAVATPQNGRIELLETEVERLSREIGELRSTFDEFRKQFD